MSWLSFHVGTYFVHTSCHAQESNPCNAHQSVANLTDLDSESFHGGVILTTSVAAPIRITMLANRNRFRITIEIVGARVQLAAKPPARRQMHPAIFDVFPHDLKVKFPELRIVYSSHDCFLSREHVHRAHIVPRTGLEPVQAHS